MRKLEHRISLLEGQQTGNLRSPSAPQLTVEAGDLALTQRGSRLSFCSVHLSSPPPHSDQFLSLPRGSHHRGDPGSAPHLYFLDDAHIQATDIELLHGATAEASLPLGIIQPDAVAAFIIFPNEQDERSAISGRILMLPSGHRHIVGNHCKRWWS